jgi:alpha-mannosidase
MSVLPSIFSPALRPDQTLLKDTWMNELIYDEHTWTYVGATSQPEHRQSEEQINLKRSRAQAAKNHIDESIQRSFAQLSGFLAPEQNSVMVFNSLGWKRSGMIDVDLQDGMEIVDNTANTAVNYEVLSIGKGIALPGFGKGYRKVRFEATEVPAFGYKLYSLRPEGRKPIASEPPANRQVLENEFYRVTLESASASITSIYDKQLSRELVDQKSSHKFGEYLYVTGGDDVPNNSLYRFGAGLNPPKLTVHPAESGKIVDVREMPYGTVATLESEAVNTPRIRTQITLYRYSKKIELRYDLHKDRVLTRESAYIAFPLEIASPSFTYGSQIGSVNPAKDELPGGSREWYVLRHWTNVSGAGTSVTIVPIDAPLVAFGDIVRGYWPSEFAPGSGGVFSWLMNNYWGTNFPAWQGGDYTFRYRITSGTTLDRVEAERFGREAMTPLETTELQAAPGKSQLPLTQAGLLELDNPHVTISAWKMAEDGRGTVLRLEETSGTAGHVRVRSDYFKFVNAAKANALEDQLSDIPTPDGEIDLSLQPYQTVTLRVQTTH